MKALFFVIAFIWMLTAAGSLLLGPFVGLDRTTLKSELLSYWGERNISPMFQFLRRFALVFSWAGFLFPVIFPIPGLVIAMLFALLT